MADDLLKRSHFDQLRINVNEPYERDFWMKEFGVSEPQLRELIHAHGVLAADLRQALGEKEQLKTSSLTTKEYLRLTVLSLRCKADSEEP